MIALCWLIGVLAGEMPDDVDLNDLDRHVEARERAMRGPLGCWEVRAVATWAVWRDGPVADGRVAFSARLDGGVWQGLDPSRVAFRPVVGRSGGARSMEALAVWLEGLKGAVETSWLEWNRDRDRIELHETQTVQGSRKEAEVLTRLGADGAVDTVSTTFPTTDLGKGQLLRGAGYDVVFTSAHEQVFPGKESLVFRIRDRGKVLRGLQELEYLQWSPCP